MGYRKEYPAPEKVSNSRLFYFSLSQQVYFLLHTFPDSHCTKDEVFLSGFLQ